MLEICMAARAVAAEKPQQEWFFSYRHREMLGCKILHAFCSASGCSDGEFPIGLTMDDAGNLIGATTAGGGSCSLNGMSGCGVLFKLIPNGVASQEMVLHAFCT